jgi:hypothetical protein
MPLWLEAHGGRLRHCMYETILLWVGSAFQATVPVARLDLSIEPEMRVGPLPWSDYPVTGSQLVPLRGSMKMEVVEGMVARRRQWQEGR